MRGVKFSAVFLNPFSLSSDKSICSALSEISEFIVIPLAFAVSDKINPNSKDNNRVLGPNTGSLHRLFILFSIFF